MPAWLGFLLPIVLGLIKTYGVPLVEAKWPALIPIVQEILSVLGGAPASENLKSAGDHYNNLVNVQLLGKKITADPK
jgi:hypothetical protein